MALKKLETKMKLPQGIFFVCVFLLVLCSCGAASTGGGTTPSTGGIANEKQSNLRIDVGSAPQMQMNSSQEIRVVLRPINNTVLSDVTLQNASIPSENATVTSTPIVTAGTPTASLLDAFGPGYTPFATATLSPVSPGLFTITPEIAQGSSNEQSLNQRSILWKWLVFAKQPHRQVLDLDIEVVWKSKQQPQQGPYRIGDPTITIDVLEAAPTVTATVAQSSTPTVTAAPQSHTNSTDWTSLVFTTAGLLTALFGLIAAAIKVLPLVLSRQEKTTVNQKDLIHSGNKEDKQQ